MSNLFKKTLIIIVVLFGLIANAASLSAAWLLYQRLTDEYKSKAISIVKSVASVSAEIFLNRDSETIQSIIDQYTEIQGLYYVIAVSETGETISHTMVPNIPASVQQIITQSHLTLIEQGPGFRESVQFMGGDGFINVSSAILGGVAGSLHVGMETGNINRAIWQTILQIQGITLLALVICIIISYRLIRGISGPLSQLGEYADKVAAHDFSAKLDVESKDEIGQLAHSMRFMSSELQSSFSRLTQAVAQATVDLEKALAYLSAIFDNLGDGLIVLDGDSTLLRVNRAVVKMFKQPENELIGRPSHRLFQSETKDGSPAGKHANFLVPAGGGGAPKTVEMQALRTDGSTFPVELSITSVDLQGEQHTICIIRDITLRKQMDEALKAVQTDLERRVRIRTAELVETNELLALEITERKAAEKKLAAERDKLTVTMRSIADGVVATDTGGSVLLINPIAEKLLGLDHQKAVGKTFETIFNIRDQVHHRPLTDPVQRVLNTQKPLKLESDVLLVDVNGNERGIEYSAAPILDTGENITGVVLVLRDNSERKRMEEQMLKADKLESIGVLAGGIAHDFNNILNAVMGNIDLCKLLADPQGKIYQRLLEAEKASHRAKDLTHQLLTFSKGGAPIKQPTALVEIIRDSTEFALHGSNVSARFSIATDLWAVDADGGQIGQVIHNLVLNVMQAMPDGGTVTVGAANLNLTRATALPPLRPGRHVQLTVADTGIGIAREIQHKILDPYFTTKSTGSGLGLAASYSIITKHDGLVEFESEPGKGTTFKVYLPASHRQTSSKSETESQLVTGSGRVLIMDDEEIILDVAAALLTKMGYTVDTARNGEEAIKRYQAAMDTETPFDLVIMDLTVPGGMGGGEAIRRLRALDPEVKAIVSSGYSNDPIMANHRHYGFVDVVAKPYRFQELSQTVNRVLTATEDP